MKIEFIEKLNQEDHYSLLINGLEDEKSLVINLWGDFEVISSNKELFEEVKQWSKKEFEDLKIVRYNHTLNNDYNNENKVISYLNNNDIHKLELLIQYDLERWNKSYSILELANEIKKNSNHPYTFKISVDSVLDGIELEYNLNDDNYPFGKFADNLISEFEKIYQISVQNLLESVNEPSIISNFEFPTEIEAACKQYLVYFTEFLKDVGVSAESKLITQSEKTIFTVTPIDKNQALELIHEYLAIYLKLPSIPEVSNMNVFSADIGVQQLKSNIQHLQSQLTLGTAILQSKEATIKSLELANFQLNDSLTSKENELSKFKEGEYLIDGIVKVNKFEYKGVSIDLAEILRRIKRKL
ncbi:hypothetical protein MY04_2571 [Flammeovirga sp. MY04]|uniref:hypothetical protein n=1 Tax=Flammeovirga sp. MY04 TaxID=1191459 RepID=UPI00080615F6|nr:hypothetical protein [Flammeovirga sp. MY04]ANQ49940.1 hypothetical protein MY04_2571 [Flammeovirga sp. MY04]